MASTIQIFYDSTEITDKCVFAQTSFEMLAAAQPGTCQITVTDRDQTLSFTTGKRLRLEVDGVALWSGYVTNVTSQYAFPAVDTTVPASVTTRMFVLRGVDINILFDKRVLRNTADYTRQLPNFASTSYDGALIRNDLCPDFLDLTDDNLDTTTQVDDVVKPVDPENEGATGEGAWLQQGSTWRQQMEDFAQLSGAVWYIGPDRALHYHSLDDAVAPWSFSDTPNGTTTIGPREVRLDEDGSVIVNDALIWGGSEWAGSGQVVFAREENTTSITNHGRWQLAEHHFGERWFKTQRGVDARANVIVNGAPGSVAGADPNRGLRFAQKQLDLVWFAHDVPSNQHLVPGMLVTTNLSVFGISNLILPLRRIRMSFPTLSSATGDAYVRFEGSLSLQLTDPKFWWDYIRKLRRQTNSVLAVADSNSTSAIYGTMFSGELTPNPDGSTTVFTINPSTFSYIAGTTQVYLNGVLQTRGAQYTESNPDSGEITFASAPAASANLWLICRLA